MTEVIIGDVREDSVWHSDMPLKFRNQIVTGDCREFLPLVPSKSVVLAFADPPYWVGYDYGNRSDKEMDYIDPAWLVTELRRIAVVVAITPGIGNLGRYPTPDWVLGWFKPGSTRRSAILKGFNTWEPILIYGKPNKRVWQDSVYLPDCANHTKGGKFHACPKPLKLLTWVIKSFTDSNDIVCDPVSGSGTTALAAKILGRNFIGCEIDPVIADGARQRVKNTQPPLFVPEPEQLSMLDV